jgi:hypothetical protein
LPLCLPAQPSSLATDGDRNDSSFPARPPLGNCPARKSIPPRGFAAGRRTTSTLSQTLHLRKKKMSLASPNPNPLSVWRWMRLRPSALHLTPTSPPSSKRTPSPAAAELLRENGNPCSNCLRDKKAKNDRILSNFIKFGGYEGNDLSKNWIFRLANLEKTETHALTACTTKKPKTVEFYRIL